MNALLRAFFLGWELAPALSAGRTTTPLGSSQVIEPLHDDAIEGLPGREAISFEQP
jgi:hypothetical protein